ncbi:MAG: phosphopyruvate hydratase [Rickettsiales bacterium]|nr:phosphopyruvate hydratase [Rickettsiales bacterium]
MTKIKRIIAREIIDSRGNPTVEVDACLENGISGRATAPSGASKGIREAVELRDGDINRFHGRGVLKAVNNVNTIINTGLIGKDCTNQENIDSILLELDGTENKSKLGANAIIATSTAVLKAASLSQKKILCRYLNNNCSLLPIPFMNILNGGAHANNGLDIQEIMIVPAEAKNIKEAIRAGAEIFSSLKEILSKKNLSTSVGDEGGFAPKLKSNTEAIELVMLAIQKAGYKSGKDIMLALDVAASEFYRDGLYYIKEKNKGISNSEFIQFLEDLVTSFPIYSIEDALAQDDYIGWQEITKKLGNKIQLVGDDIFVTNEKILSNCIKMQIGNSILIKPNQIGTITETLRTIRLAQKNNYNCIMSHRSGETEDTVIAHLAVGFNCNQIKIGSICRSDRTAKYNELIRIEEYLAEDAKYSKLHTVFAQACYT